MAVFVRQAIRRRPVRGRFFFSSTVALPGETRVTQHVPELANAGSSTLRETQFVVEVALPATTSVRVSQTVLELANAGQSKSQVSQFTVEVALPATTAVRATQVAVEVASAGASALRVTQFVAAEVAVATPAGEVLASVGNTIVFSQVSDLSPGAGAPGEDLSAVPGATIEFLVERNPLLTLGQPIEDFSTLARRPQYKQRWYRCDRCGVEYPEMWMIVRKGLTLCRGENTFHCGEDQYGAAYYRRQLETPLEENPPALPVEDWEDE